MKIFEGKSPAERNKIIAAIVIGTLAVLALGNMIFAPFSGSKKTITVNISPTPAAASTKTNSAVTAMPKQSEIDSAYLATPVFVQYPPSASDAGRNIFAFYEPPIPTPFSPTPIIIKEVKTPTPIPVPQPDLLVSFISKQNVYAGEKGFKLDIGGDKFTPDTYIFFAGSQLPTTYLSPQQLSAEIPTNFIAAGGQRTIEVKSADGKHFSNIVIFNVQQPPAPQFQYLGVVTRKRGNNDTAYIQEQGKTTPSSVRLNDIIGGRFRLVSISPAKLLVQDINLGFLAPYQIKLVDGAGQNASTRQNQNPPFSTDGTYQTYQNGNIPPIQQCAPGIPCNVPPQPQKDVDDNDDGDN